MGKEHKIKKRIRTVRNINQITKAMEMTAASKLRRAQEAVLRSRTYSASARGALARLRSLTGKKMHPLFSPREGDSHLIILFSSDRGLAGAYNSNLFKTVLSLDLKNLALIIVGQRGAQFVSKLGSEVEVVGAYTHFPVEVTPSDIRPIAATAMEMFTEGKVSRVSLLYTDFESTLKQVVRLKDILPVEPATIKTSETVFEPSAETVVEYIVPRLIEVQIYQASLEATASEHAARMVAMKNASDNAKELSSDLTLAFNRARQAGITQELAEISAGAQVIL